jgi:hypothetical protein
MFIKTGDKIMAEQKITIEIDENGKIDAKTDGIKGVSCMEELDKILGNETTIYSKKTDDIYKRDNKRVKLLKNHRK